MKLVSEALYASPLSLTPQPISSTAFRVPIARPDWEKRQQLVRQASELCENARMSVRSTRGKGLKDSKSDLDAKLVNKEDGRNDVKVVRQFLSIRVLAHADNIYSCVAGRINEKTDGRGRCYFRKG